VPRSSEYNLGTELIFLSVNAYDEFSDGAPHAIKSKKSQIGVLLGSLETSEQGVSNGTSRRANRQVDGTQTPCQGSKCAQMGSTQLGKPMGTWGGEVGDGPGKRVMECEMCTKK
jgi:hypothetical protein